MGKAKQGTLTMHRIASILIMAVWGSAVSAQSPGFEAELAYTAREEVPDGMGGELDNDIARATLAYAWSAGDGRMRAALEFGGMNNDDWDGDLTAAYGGEIVFARRVGNQRYAIGGRVRTADDLSTTTELAYALQHLAGWGDLRGLVGAQFVAEEDDVAGRDAAGAYVQGEAVFYPSDNWAVSAAALADPDGYGLGLGTEYRPRSWGGLSLFAEYGFAPDDYRDVDEYDALWAGIRFAPGTSSLKAARQGSLGRLMRRVFEVQ